MCDSLVKKADRASPHISSLGGAALQLPLHCSDTFNVLNAAYCSISALQLRGLKLWCLVIREDLQDYSALLGCRVTCTVAGPLKNLKESTLGSH